MRGRGSGRVNITGAVCHRPDDRPHFLYQLHVCQGRKGEQKTFTWREYRDLAEGIWSLLKRSIANFVATNLIGLVRVVKRRLTKIQCKPDLIEGCLAETGLIVELW
ncbi:hypothetical protein [Streptomyces sp. NBC_00467]|uniref:hypothetical protein n=1 Tax=Streptomyces sp. NBC_00467 TaxID=2975752 RepID=UPI002E178CDE